MAKFTKEEIEGQLEIIIDECLQSGNQDRAIESISYDEKTEKVTVVFSTYIDENGAVLVGP